MSLPSPYLENDLIERQSRALLVSAPGLMCNALQTYLRSVRSIKLTSCDHITPANYLRTAVNPQADVVIILEDRNISEAERVIEAALTRCDHFMVIVPDTYRQFSLQQMITEPILVWSLLNLTFEAALTERLESSPSSMLVRQTEWNNLQAIHN